ncbi:MAG: hypothetical protein ABSG04_05330 [Verrucomicrobiota bacterium]
MIRPQLAGFEVTGDRMGIIDSGAPWSWLALFFITSLLALRPQISLESLAAVILKSLAGAFATWIAFWIIWFSSEPFFDPYW